MGRQGAAASRPTFVVAIQGSLNFAMWGLRDCSSRIAYGGVLVLFLSAWHTRATGRISVEALAVFAALSGVALIYGRAFTRRTALSAEISSNLTLQFVLGFFAVILLSFFRWFRLSASAATR